jgi:3-oxoacyl-[acyl-carrier-protein] synthase II
MKRVVITGLGIVSPIGSTLESFWANAKAGKSGTGLIQNFDTTDYACKIAGEVEGFNPEDFVSKKDMRRTDPFCIFALAASRMGVDHSGLDMESEDPNRMGAIIGSGIGGLVTLQTQHSNVLEKGPGRCSPFLIPQMIVNMASGLVAIQHNLRGPNYSVVSACASAAHSIGEAKNIITRGEADVMIAGGAEAAVCELGIAGFASMKALSTRNDEPTAASRPFDQTRDGFVMGEGAAIVVLEEYERAKARGANIYCEVAGFGMSCDASHITAPAPDGEGAVRAMKMAMDDGEINPEDVSYINAHGTSTPLNDKIETLAIKGSLGEEKARKTMISSSKSMTGHLLGAAAGVESIICAMAIREGVVTPTINYGTPDPECDLDYVPNEAREADVEVTLNNSLGFGGHNACLAFRKI